MSPSPLTAYKNALERELKGSTEHTFRPALKTLLEALAPGTTATNEPKRVKCGAPDFVVTRKQTPLGYVEAKDIGKSLDEEEKSEQLTRYRESLGNLILTDYLEFRWYVQGEHRLTARLAKEGPTDKLRLEKEGAEKVGDLLNAFFAAKVPTVGTPKELAARMAALARLIRDVIQNALKDEDRGGTLHEQMEGFRKVLLHDLTQDQFGDMYAQTICYGLFAARCNMQGSGPFTREHAAYDLPKTNPFLRQMFGHIAGPDLDNRVVWAVDDLVELLKRAEIRTILEDFGKRTRQEDPVVHFYETFLAAYDSKLREIRGVYYTPEPVVSYIVRSIDHILKDFGLKDGLANSRKIKVKSPDGKKTSEVHKVQILDPATGTGTFLHAVVDQIHEAFRGNEGMWSGYVSEHLLPRLFGFELLMAPYAVAHMKLGIQLAETGYDFKSDERLGIYLTNSLEEFFPLEGLVTLERWLAEEANAAGKVKQEVPVMVVLGNPPYSGHSANKGKWIRSLIETYKENCPELKKPAQAKWLSDDYVKFIRFGQWRIEQTGYGILAFISNHAYLDNPTFRGMRQALMKVFDDIYILDLHGNSNRKEKAPDGSKDENVFDIQQGVAIGIFVKHPKRKNPVSVVCHADLWGVREVQGENKNNAAIIKGGKYLWLWENELSSTKWTKLDPREPLWLFVPHDVRLQDEYNAGWSIADIFNQNGDPAPGIVTTHDEFAISLNKEEAIDKVERLLATASETEARSIFRLCSQNQWQYSHAKSELMGGTWRSEVMPLLYRPFDKQWTVFNRNVAVHRRERVMRHMLSGENLGLATTRSVEIGRGFEHVLCSRHIIQHHTVSIKEVNYLFPLYLYGSSSGKELFEEKRPNVSSEFMNKLRSLLKLTPLLEGMGDRNKTLGPEDVFSYIYSLLYSPTYRNRYAQFLKRDFPRVPLTSNKKLFQRLCDRGTQLIALHLMEKYGPEITRYPVKGDDTVEKVRYTAPGQGAEKGRAWINKTQYFEGVPPEVWDFHIGGYQVCEKWLKDRKGRKLSFDDLTHYQRIVSALAETIRLMAEIDAAIEAHGGWPIK